MIQERDDIVALDSAIIQHPRTWEASGHLAGFTDPLVECLASASSASAPTTSSPSTVQAPGVRRRPDRAARVQPDVRDDDRAGEGVRARRSTCGPRPRRASSSTSRPCSASRAASRRSGSPRSASRSATRSRRATSSSARSSSSRWRWSSSSRPPRRSSGTSTGSRRAWSGTSDLGIRPDHLRLRPHDADELSHYSSATSDVEYLYPIGWSELEGIANRGDFDLTQHAKFSGEKLEYFDQQTGERYVPHVIEPAAGVGRTVLAFLCDAYDEDEIGGEQRTVLKLHPALAPVKVAVLPLLRKDGHPEVAREIHATLKRAGLQSEYDEGGSIGKRYRRQDEIGTPYASRRPPDARGPHRHAARPRHAHAGADRDRRAARRAAGAADARRGSRRSSAD